MVSPVTGNPFLGLAQGAQVTQGFMDAFRAPQLQQLQLLQEQAKLEQMRGLDPVSQSQMAAREAQTQQGQQRIDLAEREQDQDVMRYRNELVMGMSKAVLPLLEAGDTESAEKMFAAIESITGQAVADEMKTVEAQRGLVQSIGRAKPPKQIESAQFKDEQGNTYTSVTMSDGSQMVTPLTPGAPQQPVGQLQQVSKGTGMTARERVNLATQEALATSEASALGKRRDAIKSEFTTGRNNAITSMRAIKDLKSIVSAFGDSGLSKAGRSLANKFPLIRDASQEEFLSLSNQVILGQKDELLGGGILSDSDIVLLQSIGPQLGNTKEGNIRILENMQAAAEASIENERLFRQHLKNGGTPEGFIIPDRLNADDFSYQEPDAPMKAETIKGGKSKRITTSSGIEFEVID